MRTSVECDAFARGLKIAAKLIEEKPFEDFLQQRYGGWDTGLGQKIENGEMDFESLNAYTLENGEPEVQSGRQEYLENILNEYIR